MNPEIKYKDLIDDPEGYKYELLEEYVYYSRTFNRTKTIPAGRKSDGATWARDVGAKERGWRKYWALAVEKFIQKYLHIRGSKKRTAAFFVHDEFCLDGVWDDGTKISNFICSMIISMILYTDGYLFEAYTWFPATFLGGGGEAKKNGWFWVKNK